MNIVPLQPPGMGRVFYNWVIGRSETASDEFLKRIVLPYYKQAHINGVTRRPTLKLKESVDLVKIPTVKACRHIAIITGTPYKDVRRNALLAYMDMRRIARRGLQAVWDKHIAPSDDTSVRRVCHVSELTIQG